MEFHDIIDKSTQKTYDKNMWFLRFSTNKQK